MKKLLSNLFFARDSRSNAILAVGILSLIVLGCTCNRNFELGNIATGGDRDQPESNSSSPTDVADGSLPSDSSIQKILSETTSDFADAIDSGDFSTLYSKTSDDFKDSYTLNQMKTAFNVFTTQKRRVVPILRSAAAMNSGFEAPPAIENRNGKTILVIEGIYRTKPLPVKTDYEYEFVDGTWKIQQLIVKIEK